MPFSFSSYVRRTLPALVGALATGGAVEAQGQDTCELQRARMVREIATLAHDTAVETGRSVFSARVMAAMEKVPRHEFVPPAQRADAYANRPLPIGHDQTISQPYIVALMTELMEVKPGDRVLEIGTGSGYQAAVLAELAASVHTVEINEPLAREAVERLNRLGYGNVVTRIGDGFRGWSEHAPFDSIMVTAAPHEVPPLIEQLKPGGRLVVPVGGQRAGQSLLVIEKRPDGTVTRRRVPAVRFVPLVDRSGKPQ